MEEPVLQVPDDSVVQLAHQLVDSGASPSRLVSRREQQRRVRTALEEARARRKEASQHRAKVA